jgi:hypothetical protein
MQISVSLLVSSVACISFRIVLCYCFKDVAVVVVVVIIIIIIIIIM